MFDWRKLPKIDAHVHVATEEMLEYYKDDDSDKVWKYATIEELLKLSEKYNIRKFILQPTNDSRMYYDTDKTNKWLSEIVSNHKDLFIAFSDVQNEGSYFMDVMPNLLEKAVKDYGLKGLKIHPNNLNIPFDDLKMVPILRKAAALKIPVMVHSNPTQVGFYDDCSIERISKMIQVFPDVTFITAHMGGSKWEDAISGVTYVDISYVLPKYVELYGIKQTNRILRMIGVDRLIFATDYPQVYNTKAEDVYETYFNILNQMDFDEEEACAICYRNICRILDIDL